MQKALGWTGSSIGTLWGIVIASWSVVGKYVNAWETTDFLVTQTKHKMPQLLDILSSPLSPIFVSVIGFTLLILEYKKTRQRTVAEILPTKNSGPKIKLGQPQESTDIIIEPKRSEFPQRIIQCR